MKVRYGTRKLEKQLTDPKNLSKAYGALARKINQRLKELAAAENLSVMMTLPAARCHPLKGNFEGQWAVDVSGNYRLLFEPDHDPLPLNEDGGLNLRLITHIRITAVLDYH